MNTSMTAQELYESNRQPLAEMTQKSLVNLCLDLVELDPEAPENKLFIEHKLNLLGTKVDGYVAVNKFADSQIDSLKQEIAFLEKQIKAYELVQAGLVNRAMYALDMLGEQTLNGSNGHKMYKSKSEYVDVSDMAVLPDYCVRNIPARREPNKQKIKEAIKGGEKLMGCFIGTRETVKFK